MKTMIPKSPKISAAVEEKHRGEIVISLDGKVLAFGKDGRDALKKAKKVMPDIDNKEFLVFRIRHKYIAI